MTTAPPLLLRAATPDDVQAMTDIYARHVLHGTGSFEEVPPDHREMLQRFSQREAASYPTLIAERGGQVAGFAYAGNYKPRSAYRFTVEDSVYIAPECIGQGVGRQLLEELISICIRAGYRQMISVIGDSANHASISLHERCGFVYIGTARGLGFKHGKWLDIVYMQRELHRPGSV
ncbi:GNAT family N-acetyltransferase [Granulosicoccus sp. 3-233]|uniref:GNAT family N-acetyltransferase n=1 Tax=Granulosicoccus sp. 3-233 TaxID=3417969 RepID=UPI003D3504EF